MNLLENVNLGNLSMGAEYVNEFAPTHEMFLIAAAATIIAGVFIGLLGLKLVRVLSAMTGLCLGAGIGVTAGVLLGTSETIVLGATIAGALVFAILFGIFKKAGMFIWIWLSVISVFGTFAVGFGLVGSIIGAVIGLVIAIISVKFFEPLVIFATSIVGGRSIAAGALMLAGMADSMILNIIVFVLVSVVCAAIQFFMHSRKIKKKQVKQANEVRDQESREKEIEMARMLLDEDEE